MNKTILKLLAASAIMGAAVGISASAARCESSAKPPMVPQFPMHLSGWVAPDMGDANLSGYIRDEGNCWHSINVDLDQGFIIIRYKDDWWASGCPDAARSSNLPEESVIDAHAIVRGSDGNVAGMYVEGPSCLQAWNYGTFAIVPQADGKYVIVMNGTRSRLRVCKP